MVYVFWLFSNARTAYVVVTWTIDPPSSTVRTIAVFSNDVLAHRDGAMERKRKMGTETHFNDIVEDEVRDASQDASSRATWN